MRKPLLLCLLVSGLSPTALMAQSDTEIVDEIVTTSQRRDNTATLTGNIGLLNQEQLQDISAFHIQDALVRVPGASFQQGNGQEYLPSIRSAVLTGAGACGGFLTAQDNIPLRAAGFCNVNELFEANTEQAARIEVIRGPSNALYGSNALQGVVNVLLPSAPESTQASLGLELGANDYRRQKLSYGTRSGDHGFVANLNTTHDGGFRDEAYYDQQKLQLRHDYNNGDLSVATTFAASNLNQETAGFISDFKDEDVARSNEDVEAFRDARSFRLYSRVDYTLGEGQLLSVTPYFRKTEMDFLQHFLPGDPLEENGQDSFGTQVAFYNDTSDAVQWIAGLDLEITDGYLVETQFNPAPFGGAIRPLGKHYDYQVDARQIAPYLNVDFLLSDRLKLALGARYEIMDYDYENKMIDGDTAEDGTPCPGGCRYSRPSDRSDDFSNFSPKIGLAYQIGQQQSLFANISHGFRAPQATELYRLQGGQVISDLKSEEVKSFEVGQRGRASQFRYEVVAYTMKKENVIYRDNADFSNLSDGKTEHYGLELDFGVALNDAWSFAAVANYAIHKYDGVQFVGGNNVDGNYLDTAPKLFGSAQLAWKFMDDAKAELEWMHMDKYFTDISNANVYKGHDVFNLRVNWSLNEQVKLSARILNLLDEKYAERADFAFGNARYFPGEPRSAYFGAVYQF